MKANRKLKKRPMKANRKLKKLKNRNNISFSTYDSGHMVYIDGTAHAKMKNDLVSFMEKSMPRE